MKRVFAFLLVITVIMILASCGKFEIIKDENITANDINGYSNKLSETEAQSSLPNEENFYNESPKTIINKRGFSCTLECNKWLGYNLTILNSLDNGKKIIISFTQRYFHDLQDYYIGFETYAYYSDDGLYYFGKEDWTNNMLGSDGGARGYIKYIDGQYNLFIEKTYAYDFAENILSDDSLFLCEPLNLNFREGTTQSKNYVCDNPNYEDKIWCSDLDSNGLGYELTIKKLDEDYIIFDFSHMRDESFCDVIGFQCGKNEYKFESEGVDSSIFGTISYDEKEFIIHFERKFENYSEGETYNIVLGMP